ncbi:hypothetical protein QBZ16_000343 [Prototheca wickerhamii]|uniref:Uncharacterized protein n=1 Tax=Prototheca wickerhamii TaxID=3111 RepID=A0AAD9MM06_PROWI|nr:hypothetical protein QBZ16_000343 [Prototheca wickerhamii]
MFGPRWGIAALALLVAGIVFETSRWVARSPSGVPSRTRRRSRPAFGLRTCIVTAAAPGVDLSALAGHDVHVVPSNATLTFEHTYTFWGNHRRLRVLAQPNVTLRWEHVPPRCRRAQTFLLGPLMPEDMDPASFLGQGAWGRRRRRVALMAQGLQRSLDASKKVVPHKRPSEQLTAALGPDTTVFLSDVETDGWPQGALASVAAATARLARAALRHPRPAAVANWAGACAVSQPQACKPACVADSMRADWAALEALKEGPPDDADAHAGESPAADLLATVATLRAGLASAAGLARRLVPIKGAAAA